MLLAPRSRARFSAVALAVTGGLIGSLMAAGPAFAAGVTVPANAADWQATPYSPLPWADLDTENTLLPFEGEAAGLPDATDIGTGFTMVQPSSLAGSAPYFDQTKLAVSGGSLNVTATPGIANAAVNTQDNTLGLGVDASAGKRIYLTTTLASFPANAQGFAQAGLWFGANDENYLKLVVVGNTATGRQIQVLRESAGASVAPSPAGTATNKQTGTHQIVQNIPAANLPAGPIKLDLIVDPAAGTATASYKFGDAAPVELGTIGGIPANISDGSLIGKPAAAADVPITAFGGVFTTTRNMTTAQGAPLTFSFSEFGIAQLDTTPPAAPTGLITDADLGKVTLDWADVADEDLAGYNVYRSTATPVATNGIPLNGNTPLADSSFVDEQTFRGIDYSYAVVAVDETANVSAPATAGPVATDLPAGEVIALLDFTTPTGELTPGYTREAGAPYSEASGLGWSDPDGVPADLSTMTRDRNTAGVEGRLDSIIHAQPTTAITSPLSGKDYTFSYDLPNGTYTIVAAVGDSGAGVSGSTAYDSNHLLRAEGQTVFGPWKANPARQFDEVTKTGVVVTDGSLTIDTVGGANTKLAYLEIYRTAIVAPAAPADLAFTLTGEDVTVTWGAVPDAASYDVYRSESPVVSLEGEPLATVTGTSVTDTETVNGGTYYYSVIAEDENGTRSLPSAVLEVVVPKIEDPEDPPVLCTNGLWKVEYFDGTALAGTPLLVECDDEISQSYAAGEQPAAFDSDTTYSMRWTKTIDQGAGSYAITTKTDDGVRVKVDGVTVVNRWFAQSGDTAYTTQVSLGEGSHEIVVEYYQSFGDAEAAVTITKAASICTAGQWRVEYFNGTGLENGVIADACVSAIDFALAAGEAPAGLQSKLGTDLWSARYTTTINEGAGTYEFRARTDDGVRILVDGQKVLDEWYDQSADEEHVAEKVLGTGSHLIVVEYYQGYNEASAEVSYERTSFDAEAPAAPLSVSTQAGQTGIAVTWQASTSSDVAGYRVYRSESTPVAITGTPVSGDALRTGTSFTDTTVDEDVQYYYAVVAVDTSDNVSTASASVPGMISSAPDTEAPAAATALAATAGNANVALTWTASAATDVAGYRVYRSTEPAVQLTGANLVSGATLVSGAAYTDSTVTNGTTYFYVVVAVDLAGNASVASNEVVTVPLVPNTTNVKVDFTATNATPATGYFADWGQAYGLRSGATQGSGTVSYGWLTQDGNPLSLVGNGRDRGRAGVPELVDSILHMQYGDVDNGNGANGVKVDGVWELAVPDGLYEVTVAVGDEMGASSYDSDHVINVEGSVGIETFVGAPAAEYRTVTTKVGVWDGKLTIDAEGGFNTKIGYIDVRGIPRESHVDTVLPENRVLDHNVTAGVSATIKIPTAGVGVNPTTLPGNVKLFLVSTGAEVPSTVGTSGGNDVIALSPNAPLTPNTEYRFVVGSGVKDNLGGSFVPFTSVFTTGAGTTTPSGSFTPLTGIAFEKVEITSPEAKGKYWASFVIGPDGKFYGSTIGQGLWRFDISADGQLTNPQNLGYEGVAQIGLLFDKSSTASDLKLWITRTTANFSEQGQWVSSIHLLSGPNLATDRTIFEGLPRSLSDHLTNSMAYGPDNRIYVLQGSNQAAGDLDGSWGQRGEQLLTAATLVFDPAHPQIVAAAGGNAPINVKTADGGTYNPYATNAPLKLFATGIRNAYDLVWHSNGHLYVPTNGTAGGANTPGVTANANGTFTRTAASGIPGFSTVNGQDVTSQCVRRGYTGGTVAPMGNIGTQRDLLFDVVEGGYYGHPNPTRCEFVLNAGGGANPAFPVLAPTKYAATQAPDPNYRGIAYDFEFNKSPNGALEYKSGTFGGQLKGRLLVVRFSNNNDILFMQPGADGKILGAQTSVGITGVPNSTMSGVDGFNDPLEIVEDTRNGNLYINQYDRSGSDQRLYLLRVPGNQQAAKISTSVSELIFSGTKSGNTGSQAQAATPRTFTVSNTTNAPIAVTAAISGANAAEFSVTGGNVTVPANGAVQVTANFTPSTTIGQRSATLTLTGGGSSVTVGLYGLTMNGIEGQQEPTLNNVLGTLGYNINVGWTNLEGGVQPVAKGDEVLEPLFVKSGTANPTMVPLAHYAPRESVPFGWYTGNGAAADRRQLGAIDASGYQSLLPPSSQGTVSSFDPGTASFGFFYQSQVFNRVGYTEDRLNDSNGLHRARIYPAKNRAGVLLTGTYIVAFEDASNGDYQDYLFVVTGVKPVTDTGSIDGAVKIDFTTAAGDLAPGYLRDFGQAYALRTGAGQGSGLSYGWKDQTTENDIDLSVGGTTPGNGRDRQTTQTDVRLDSFMHMQATMAPQPFNGTSANAYWQLALPNGSYQVTVGVGDPAPQNSAEVHQINVEETALISTFTPTGASGAATRHRVATATVEVTDGFLTVDAIGGTNTKIGFIDVVPVDDEEPLPGGDPSEGAQVKINFQPAGAPTPEGWTADTGTAFSGAAGFGWVSPAGAPVDRSTANRYRTGPLNGIAYPTDVKLQTYAFLQTQPGPANWEYVVPNGTYEVALSVGDAHFLDSVHTVTAEGQVVVNNFAPTETTPFQTGKRTVTVTDGRLTIAATGTNGKINWVSIKGDGLAPVDPTETVKINYQPTGVATPTGWAADFGNAYTEARGYGWLSTAGAPLDRTDATRYRTAASGNIAYPTGDVTRQTLILTQGDTADVSDGVWQYKLANGTYTVSVSVGDAGFIDSVHGIRAENTALITGYTPTNAAPFGSGSAEVTVTDGFLTLTPTGTNTKLNWVTIAGDNLSLPSIEVAANGFALGSTYTGGEANVTINAAASGDATIESLTYAINNGAAAAYNGPIALTAAGTYTLTVTATDSEDRVATRTVTFTIENVGGTLALRNEQATRNAAGVVIPGFSENTLVMQRINSGVTAHLTVDTANLTLTNTGTKPLRISSLTITGAQAAQFQLVNPPATPILIQPGASQALQAKFIGTGGNRGVRTATLNIATTDPASPVTAVQLRGGYMGAPEGGSELTLQEISNLFGYTTNIGNLQNGDEMRTSALDGDEVRSLLWKRMDTSQPVIARQLAAFHGCCEQTEVISINGTSSRHTAPYGQSILPPSNANGAPTQVSTSPGGNFTFTVSGQTTNNANYMALKTWPVKDAAGNTVPGAWIVGHDYISSPNQCGIAPTNCDFQDNVYLITNMLPVASSDTTAPAAPTGLAGTVQGSNVALTWAAPAAADGVAGYIVERATAAGGPFTRISAATPQTARTFTDTALPFADHAFYRVLAVDASNNVSAASAVVDVDISAVPNKGIRFHAGTLPLTTSGGAVWAPDTSYAAGGGLYTNSNLTTTSIANTEDDALYLTERSDVPSFGYNVPLAAGVYQVKLHFAEIYFGAPGGGLNQGGNGRRVFNINFEGGANEYTGFDIIARAGGTLRALVTTNTVAVTDGNLDIDFNATVNFPAIQAVEIVRTGDVPTPPAAPTGVTAVVNGSANAVSWTAVSGATGYFVERATAAAGPWTRLNTTAQAGTALSDAAGSTFPTALYRVIASNAGLESAPSATATVTRPQAPAAPTGLTGTVSGTANTLSWTAVTGATGYIVERATAAAGPWTQLNATAQTGTTFSDAAGSTFPTALYRVIAVNAVGNSAPSATVTVTRGGTQQPVRINAGGPATTIAGVTWAADNSFAGGKTYSNAAVTAIAGTTADALYLTERSATTNLGGFGYNIPLQPGTYTIRLHFAEIYHGATGGGSGGTGKRVFSANFEGGTPEVVNLDLNAQVAPMTAYITTNTVSVTDGNLDLDFTATVDQPKVSAIEILPGTVTPAAPAAPTGVTAAVNGSANAVSWSAVTGATGYFVERATAAAGPWTRLNAAAQTGTALSDAAGSTFPTALYRVIAVNAGGESAPSATATVTRPQPPAAPTGLTGTVSGTANALSWTAVTGATGYFVERATAAAGPWTRLTATAQTGTTFSDAAGSTFPTALYRVIATNAAGSSAPSATTTVTRPATPTQQPVRINAGGGTVTIGGVQWLSDRDFAGGKTYSNAAVTAIAGTTADALYLTERSATTNLGGFGYNIPLQPGTYTIRLHFAEIYHGATGGGSGGTGKRVFSANFEGGTPEVVNLDLNAQVAPMTAYITTNTVSVTDGNLDLDFTATVDQPKVSAIEILPGTVTPAAPAAPTGVTAAAAGTANTVSWSAVSGATGYFVERATAAAGPWTRLNTTAQTATTFSDAAGATFVPTAIYRVVATNAAGNSAPSATATVTRQQAPAAPSGVTAVVNGSANAVSWSAVTGATGYFVERATAAAGPWTRLNTTAQSGTTFSDAAGSTFPTALYRVVATNAAGSSAPSSTATVTRAPAQQPVRINTGGGAITVGGVTFAADTAFSGGKTFSNSAVTAISRTTADALYLDERSATANGGGFSYDIPVANGTYTVRLHHAEIWFGATSGGPAGNGNRVFSVNFEGGSTEVVNRDIFANVGSMAAYVTAHNVTVTGGNLDIDFTASVNQPSIAAIEVLPGANATTAVPGGAPLGAAVVAPGQNNTPVPPSTPVVNQGVTPQVATPTAATPTVTTPRVTTPRVTVPGTLVTVTGQQQVQVPTTIAVPEVRTPQVLGTEALQLGAPASVLNSLLPQAMTLPREVVAGQPDVIAAPREIRLFGKEGFAMRSDTLAGLLLLGLMLALLAARRLGVFRWVASLGARLAPREAESRP